jgi:hypothetical protein
MAYTANDYAQAVWEYGTRSLAAGTPAAPASPADGYSQAVWAFSTRALTVPPSSPVSPSPTTQSLRGRWFPRSTARRTW